ncbi:unnamed protein product [Amoebophrya sp. A120]|nr:unnamed protein product [Amoebophrya sp. A120]|eukprot:GSA120T00000365001.1
MLAWRLHPNLAASSSFFSSSGSASRNGLHDPTTGGPQETAASLFQPPIHLHPHQPASTTRSSISQAKSTSGGVLAAPGASSTTSWLAAATARTKKLFSSFVDDEEDDDDDANPDLGDTMDAPTPSLAPGEDISEATDPYNGPAMQEVHGHSSPSLESMNELAIVLAGGAAGMSKLLEGDSTSKSSSREGRCGETFGIFMRPHSRTSNTRRATGNQEGEQAIDVLCVSTSPDEQKCLRERIGFF